MNGDNDLASRVVLVTGAAGCLGRATALAAAAAGAVVVLSGRKLRPLEKVYDEIVALQRAEPALYPMDLEGATEADYDAMATAIADRCGGLDAIVHSAARFEALTPLVHTSADSLLRTLHVNLAAPMLLTRACLPLLQRSEDAAVVLVLEDAAEMRKAYRGAYGVAKSALPALLELLHAETDLTRVRVHGVRPPPMASPLRARAWFAENAGLLSGPDSTAQAIMRILAGVPDAARLRGRVMDIRDAGVAQAGNARA